MSSTYGDIDEHIDRLKNGGTLTENEVKNLCEKVRLLLLVYSSSKWPYVFYRIVRHTCSLYMVIITYKHHSDNAFIGGIHDYDAHNLYIFLSFVLH